jgi:hypothetical protein
MYSTRSSVEIGGEGVDINPDGHHFIGIFLTRTESWREGPPGSEQIDCKNLTFNVLPGSDALEMSSMCIIMFMILADYCTGFALIIGISPGVCIKILYNTIHKMHHPQCAHV